MSHPRYRPRGTLLAFREDRDDQSKRRGKDQRREHPKTRTRSNQLTKRVRRRRQGRHPGEARETHQEHPAMPEPVAEVAAGEKQPGEDERVRVDDPLQSRDPRPEIARHGRQRDVDDRVVDHHQELSQTQRTQRHPARTHATPLRCGFLFYCCRTVFLTRRTPF